MEYTVVSGFSEFCGAFDDLLLQGADDKLGQFLSQDI
jgi:hypothetical protein